MSSFNQQAVETAAKEVVKLTSAESRSLKVEQFTEKSMRKEILNSEMTLKDKTDKNVEVKTSDLISAIIKDIWLTKNNTSGQILQRVNSMEIKIGNIVLKPWQFTAGSTNVAYIQIALGADPDGYFGRDTLIAAKSMDMVDTVNNASNTPENIGEISINMLSQENFYDDFITLLGQEAADKYKDVYKLFNINWVISSIKINNVMKTVTMEYCYSVANNSYNTISVRIQDIQNPNRNIDKAKFVQEIVKAINKNEARLNYTQLKASIEKWVKNVPINKFDSVQLDYIKTYGWYTNEVIDFAPADVNSTGMKVEWDNLVVTYGTTNLTPVRIDISKIKTANNTFDQAKFVTELQNQSLTKLAKDWVESDMSKYTKRGKENYKISSINDLYNGELLKNRIANMKARLERNKSLLERNKKYYGTLIDQTKITELNKQQEIITARVRIEDYYRIFRKYTTTPKKDIAESEAEITKNIKIPFATVSNELTWKFATLFNWSDVSNFDKNAYNLYKTAYSELANIIK